ncbi:MAG: MBL fold metallo-hydrolase [Fimbriimonas sp.]|nr:MBL fold metallo-hydrolase [Fimbriimonas sp.]
MAQSIGFYGAAETVTGSRHLISIDNKKVLVDCGMFQGSRELRDRNWEELPVPPSNLDAVIITHAHLDHIGWIPRLVAEGYEGPIYATKATIELCKISLPDSGRLQEEDAHFSNKHGTGNHHSTVPLYTEKDAYQCLKWFKHVEYNHWHELPGRAQFRFHTAGHILGSAFAEIVFQDGTNLLMSGDLGRYNTPIIKDPTAIEFADYLVIESTYGDRLHSHEDPLQKIASIIHDTMESGGALIIPSFAIGRTQELLYYFRVLQDQGRIPRIPIYIDSPMAVSVTHVYEAAKEELDEEMVKSVEAGRSELEPEGINFVRDRETSKALNSQRGPIVIVSGSGMANGGRVTHHLLHRLPNPNTIVLFTGYQAEGTLGRRLIEGAKEVHLHGEVVDVRARIEKVNALSAHADQGEILKWLGNFKKPPKDTFIVHGEPVAQEALQSKIVKDFGWKTTIPKQADEFDLA